jgi:hypothetical protein
MEMMQIKHHKFNEREIDNLIDRFVIPMPKGFSEYLEISEYLKNLKDVAEAIEDGVDWLFEDFLESSQLYSGKNLR